MLASLALMVLGFRVDSFFLVTAGVVIYIVSAITWMSALTVLLILIAIRLLLSIGGRRGSTSKVIQDGGDDVEAG